MKLAQCLFVVSGCAGALLAADAQGAASEVAAQDALSGVWKGVARGNGVFLPKSGAPATLLLRRSSEGELTGRAIVQGLELERLKVSLEDEGRTLKLAGVLRGMPMQATLEVDGGHMLGQLAGIGVYVDLEVRRIAHEVLEAPPDEGRLRDLDGLAVEAWVEDLRFLEVYMPQVHANAFHSQTEEDWHAAIEAAIARLSELDARGRVVALAQVVASVGDAHTGLGWRDAPGFRSTPIGMEFFQDGLFVTSVDERWGEALGARVVRVGTTDVAAALDAVGTLFAAENESWRSVQEPSYLPVPGLLSVLGIADSDASLPLTLELDGGEELELEVGFEGDGKRIRAPDPRYDPLPLWRTRTSEWYWFEVLEDSPAVYFAYNSCRDDPARPMAGFIGDLLRAFDDAGAERLIVDLRNNAGGNSNVLSSQLGRLAEHLRIGVPGGLVGLIGPRTYSSGMLNAYQLRADAGAVLLGQPTGGKPNCYGEMLSFRLPNSQLAVYYSVKYFRLLEDVDPLSVEPDQLVELASFEHMAGEDPVLRCALEL